MDPNSLRSGGKFRKFADWEHVKQTCDSIGAQQLLELKRVTSDFQKDRMREHKSIESKLNKRTEAPVNFAFTEDYDHISVAKCRYCKAWLFWPETTQKEWCCGQGKYIELINPWSQPTDAFRSLCIDDTNEAKSFRLHSRAINQESSTKTSKSSTSPRTLARAQTRRHRSQRRRRSTSSTATSSMRSEPLPP
jgi:hypothetical protein